MKSNDINTTINRLAAVAARREHREACSALTWMLTLDGPIAIADKAAWELVQSECAQEVLDGYVWYRVGPDQFELDVQTDAEERAIAVDVARAIRYLSARGLLLSHDVAPLLVRAAPELKQRFLMGGA